MVFYEYVLGFSLYPHRVLSDTNINVTEVRDNVQETGIKTIPMEKKCKKAKWLSEEALQIAVKKKRSEKQRRKGKI